VPGTTRNSGSRNLDLTAVNAYRALSGLAAVSESQIESSRVNLVDMRVNKDFALTGTMRLQLIAQVFNLFNTKNLQGQYEGGRVTSALAENFGAITSARPSTQGELGVRLVW